MADEGKSVLPRARRDGLLFQPIDDEVIVYDTERHKAHCLNRTAARVWEQCDGQTTVAEVARRLAHEFNVPVDQTSVWLAVEQLGKAHLLTEVSRPQGGLSRRELLKRLGVAAAVAIPLVTTIVTPAAAQGASCIPEGAPCDPTGGPPCCNPLDNFCVSGSGGFTCVD